MCEKVKSQAPTPFKALTPILLAQLKNYTFICLGSGIEWEELDYQLSIESMLHLESRVA